MTTGGLHDPLGRQHGPSRSPGMASVLGRPVAVGGMVTLVVALVALFQGDGGGGEPFAIAAIERPEAPTPRAQAVAVAPAEPLAKVADSIGGAAPQEIEIQNGVRIIRPGATRGSATQVIKVAPEGAAALSAVPDPRLVESGPFGPLPRIGSDGSRPAEVYARPPGRDAGTRTRPQIAILIGGMGLDASATGEAARATPPAVTFGFAPYGADLQAQLRNARDAGHETVLQLPMEDVDGSGAGLSHRLLAGGKPGNPDRLKWLLARCTGYAGVSNYLGGRFLADEEALAPLMRELAARGLFFVDDGSATRSLAPSLAGETTLPVLRADVVLDANPAPAAMTEAWARLETIARDRGSAVGTASALPATVALVTRLAGTLPSKGIRLVPVSEAALRPTAGSANATGP